ncbi:MAG TPA: vWA domain-containing protein [Polyangia bacterium]|nr:vWA domain-containing protein [Polyangia bacterium]
MDPTRAGGGHGEWQITMVGGLDRLALVLLVAAAAVVLAWTWRSFDPRLAWRWRLGLLGLRLCILAAAFALLMQPTSSSREVRAHPSRFAVIVDTSGSMSLGQSQSRLAKARRILDDARPGLEILEREHRLAWYSFADGLAPAEGIDDALRPTEGTRGTDLFGALRALRAAPADEPPVGVLLVSDGADTSLASGAEPSLAVQALRELGLPVNTLAITAGGRERDLSISLDRMDAFTFSRSETPVTVAIRGVGISASEVEVSLWNEGSLMQQKTVGLVGGEGRVTFPVRPQRLGQQILTVSVPVPEGDEVPQNNTAHVGFEVIRDKLRVLHVAGQPSWDQRFLRDALRNWPRVDLVSFYVLRTPQQSETFGTSGLALIPFPTEGLFEDHLEEFDVVIFQDFDPAPVGVDRYLEALAGFVRGGGGFVIVGGAVGFGSGAMARGALGGLLPVRLPDPQAATSLVLEQTFRPRPTDAGRRHPVLRLVPERVANDVLLASLGRLDGLVRVAGIAPGGIALLEHPHLTADDGPAPLIAVREAGDGRTLAVATDSLWRLRFSEPLRGGVADVFPEFWRQAMNWLVRDPELDRLRVAVTPLEQEPDRAVKIEIELSDEAYRPMPGAELALTVLWQDEAGIEQTDLSRIRLDGEGRYRREWMPRASGPHRVTATTDDGLSATGRFLVASGHPELTRLDADDLLLAGIATATGGRHFVETLDPGQLARMDAPAREVLSRRDTSLWDHPLALLLLLTLLAADWLLRRRLGVV